MQKHTVRVLGLDPGLRRTGWGVLDWTGTRLAFVACGTITSDETQGLAARLVTLYEGIVDVLRRYEPAVAAVEQTFVNKDPVATLKLGQARAMALFAPAQHGLPVHEYAPNLVKKSVVGTGHAAKDQVAAMVQILLPKADLAGQDSADALAVAICHAHHAGARSWTDMVGARP